MEEIQNRDWQYLVESVIKLVEHDKSHLKSLPKAERKIMKSMKYNYRVARRVYASTYANIAEQFKIYLNSLSPAKIDEIENNSGTNRNGLLFTKWKVRPNYLILLQCFTISTGDFPIRMDIFLFLMVKLLLELLEKN